jgi:protease II
MAMSLISALHDIGMNVPENISVIGFDDVPNAAFFHPPLTTVQQPVAEIVSAAVTELEHRIISMDTNTSKRITQGLYEWLDNKNILFYGIDLEKKDLSKIYEYNIDDKKETVFYDGISGYCSFFSISDSKNILIIDNGSISDRKMKIIDLNSKECKEINFLYDKIFDFSVSPDGNYAAVTASETPEDRPHVFIYDLKANKIEMNLSGSTNEVITSKGYLVWDKEKLYFTGKTEEKYNIYCLYMGTREIKSVTDLSDNCLFPQKVKN